MKERRLERKEMPSLKINMTGFTGTDPTELLQRDKLSLSGSKLILQCIRLLWSGLWQLYCRTKKT